MFTKMNLRWGYNNVRIKKGNKQKTAFLIPEGIFEPIVMFFRLTNLLATFQTIINDLLRDIIEVENIAAFIDDIMVGTEIEEGHNKIVKEVLRMIAKNDLFIKLEKYIQKIRKVRFLGVVIKPDRVKI